MGDQDPKHAMTNLWDTGSQWFRHEIEMRNGI